MKVGMGVRIGGCENIQIGKDFLIMDYSSLIADRGEIRIGDNVRLNTNTTVNASLGGRIVIGNDILIAQNVVLRASDHCYSSLETPIVKQGHIGGEIVIEDDVWICANSVVTKDVRIGAHSIVGAGSVVTKDVPPYSIVGGVPAVVLKTRQEATAFLLKEIV
jgi:galactoside O-acetyltransferase